MYVHSCFTPWEPFDGWVRHLPGREVAFGSPSSAKAGLLLGIWSYLNFFSYSGVKAEHWSVPVSAALGFSWEPFLVTSMPCFCCVHSCCVKQVSLIILWLDQFVSLAKPYYYCFYLFIYVLHRSETVRSSWWAGLMWEKMVVSLSRGFCERIHPRFCTIKTELTRTVQDTDHRGQQPKEK